MVKTDIISMAGKNLMRRKGRTFLTMLGVLIGTTSIVVMVSLGIGIQEAQRSIYEQWGSLNEITVNQSYRWSSSDDDMPTVALNDEAIDFFGSLDGVAAVVPMANISANSATSGKLQGWLDLYGIRPEDMDKKDLKVAYGRGLEVGDRNVILIGGMMGENFYDPNSNDRGWWNDDETWEEYQTRVYEKTVAMLNKKINAEFMNYETENKKKLTLQIVGVLEKGNGSYYSAYAPLDVVQRLQKQLMTAEERRNENRNDYTQISVITKDVSDTTAVLQTIKDAGYNAYSIAESLDGMEDAMRIPQLALGGIGSITLLVAAIGIINTMVMSIYERTKEIAIMKVIGATFNDIRLMFLTEAAMIGMFGGLMGLGFSYGLSYLINLFTGEMMGNYVGAGGAIKLSVIPWWLALFAIIFSILVGLLAGVYPANRAVKLSPIEAMRNN